MPGIYKTIKHHKKQQLKFWQKFFWQLSAKFLTLTVYWYQPTTIEGWGGNISHTYKTSHLDTTDTTSKQTNKHTPEHRWPDYITSAVVITPTKKVFFHVSTCNSILSHVIACFFMFLLFQPSKTEIQGKLRTNRRKGAPFSSKAFIYQCKTTTPNPLSKILLSVLNRPTQKMWSTFPFLCFLSLKKFRLLLSHGPKSNKIFWMKFGFIPPCSFCDFSFQFYNLLIYFILQMKLSTPLCGIVTLTCKQVKVTVSFYKDNSLC